MANFFEALDVLCEEGMSLGEPDDFPAGEPRSKASAAAAAPSDDGSEGAAEEARRRELDPFDFFDLLDMLADEGGLGDVEDLDGGGGSKARAVVVTRKHPVGCRQRNVVRPQPMHPSIYEAMLSAESRALRDTIEKLLKKHAADAELERLEYLKTATF